MKQDITLQYIQGENFLNPISKLSQHPIPNMKSMRETDCSNFPDRKKEEKTEVYKDLKCSGKI